MTKTWLITGASSGLGYALAEAVLANGDRVAGAARRPELLNDLVARHPQSALAVKLDVTKPNEVYAAVTLVEEQLGPIDVLVNNAGYGLFGAIEELSAEEYRRLYETNVFGLIEMMRTVSPNMRERRSGTIVNVSSMMTTNPSAGGGHYTASKAAVEMITEAARAELREYNVRTMIVMPGAFRTPGFDAMQFPQHPLDAYATTTGTMPARMAEVGKIAAGNPEKGAKAIIKAVDDPNGPFRLPIGVGVIERMLERYNHLADNAEKRRVDVADMGFDPA